MVPVACFQLGLGEGEDDKEGENERLRDGLKGATVLGSAGLRSCEQSVSVPFLRAAPATARRRLSLWMWP